MNLYFGRPDTVDVSDVIQNVGVIICSGASDFSLQSLRENPASQDKSWGQDYGDKDPESEDKHPNQNKQPNLVKRVKVGS